MPRLSADLEVTLRNAIAYAKARSHREATHAHLLLALIDDPDGAGLLRGSGADINELRVRLIRFLDHELAYLVDADQLLDAKPNRRFERAVQRAAIRAQEEGKAELNGADVLVGVLIERESYDVFYALQEQGISSATALRFLEQQK